MERADAGLAFLLRYENIAWYDAGQVRILDRRIYPLEIRFVACRTHLEVRDAIRDMVTQSAGPYTAAAMGMALAAFECRGKSPEDVMDYLRGAAFAISHARPTTSSRMELVCQASLQAAQAALENGKDVSLAIRDAAVESNDKRYRRVEKMAGYMAALLPQKPRILTQCFGETIVGQTIKVARGLGIEPEFYCAETRPYFQGARLTASVVRDMGCKVTVVTDNMPAYLMQNEDIDLFTSAADVITLDGHVVNKVGTFQIAIAADYLGVPYYVSGTPDVGHADVASVNIEMRDSSLVLEAMGVKTTMDGVLGYYPSFDITPPGLVRGVVTDEGVFSPYDLARYLEIGNKTGELII